MSEEKQMPRVRRLLVLDFDGVLNRHEHCHGSPFARFNPDNVAVLRSAVEQLGGPSELAVVVCSAWRQLVHDGFLSCRALAFLLATHGVPELNIVGVTSRDDGKTSRDGQVLDAVEFYRPERWVVVDDMALPFIDEENHVRPAPNIGLEWHHASQIVKALK